MKNSTRTFAVSIVAMAAIQITGFSAHAEETDTDALLARIEKLEADNAKLMEMVERLLDQPEPERIDPASEAVAAVESASEDQSALLGIATEYGFDVLDHAERVNRKRMLQLEARQSGQLNQMVTLSGGVTMLADYQTSNRDDKFGYLMRHPTLNNQIGDTVSEAVVHSSSFAVTAALTDNITAYFEMLYSPEQSFGAGTITSLTRNQIQMRQAYLMWGNLDESPVYASIGKMYTPFGLNDTVSPFSNSSVWHAFAGLAYGAEIGYLKNGLNLRAMAIQGGSQFRAANTPVDGTNVPSKLNNFAIDASYSFGFGGGDAAMFGASYEHGSAYCQSYPVVHFNPCDDNNPAWAAYSSVNKGPFEFLAEYAQTTDVWPGSEVPDPTNPLSQYDAQKTRSFMLGGRYGFGPELVNGEANSALSLEYSTFIAGDTRAPWERQDQWVLGYSRYLVPNVNLFGEMVHVVGYSPLNFISGGNFTDGSTWSDRGGRTNVILLGAQAAF
ncbi:hypothetical protein [Hyphomonas sp.]|uniref:hypothetical protein n=1 Tax=Hyphomonas sp. TaxID=87 RepID=UPI003528A626